MNRTRRPALMAMLILFLTVFIAPLAAAQESSAPAEAQALIDILENDEKRTALIEQLKAAAAPVVEAAAEEPASLGRQIAEFTKEAAEKAAASFAAAQSAVMRAPEAFDSLSTEQIDLLV